MLNSSVGTVFNGEDLPSVAPSQRLHLVLLGVGDVSKARQFYEGLGWAASPSGHEGFVKFDLGGYALSLISKDDLAKDANFDSAEGSGFPGIALIYLAKTPEEVPLILKRAEESGGAIVKPATRTHWGIAGYFTDPDGHLFEVDYERPWVFDQDHFLVVDEMREEG